MLDVDPDGFDELDRRLLRTDHRELRRRPGRRRIAGRGAREERGTIEDVIEPYLIQQGFLVRTARGRMATREGLPAPGLEAADGARDLFAEATGWCRARRRMTSGDRRDDVTALSMRPEPVFSWPTRVYWEDTDAGGVVYHAQYLAFLERARTEWLRAPRLRPGASCAREHDLVFAVRAMQIDFRKPARLDDALDVTVELRECRRASLVFAQAIRAMATRAARRARCAWLRWRRRFPPARDPAPLYEALKALERHRKYLEPESRRNDRMMHC